MIKKLKGPIGIDWFRRHLGWKLARSNGRNLLDVLLTNRFAMHKPGCHTMTDRGGFSVRLCPYDCGLCLGFGTTHDSKGGVQLSDASSDDLHQLSNRCGEILEIYEWAIDQVGCRPTCFRERVFA